MQFIQYIKNKYLNEGLIQNIKRNYNHPHSFRSNFINKKKVIATIVLTWGHDHNKMKIQTQNFYFYGFDYIF